MSHSNKESYSAQQIREAYERGELPPDPKDTTIASLKAERDAVQAEIARLREALTKARQHMVLLMVFHGRDFGTPRWDYSLTDLMNMTVDAEAAARAALEPKP